MANETNSNQFNRKLVSLLILQRERVLAVGKDPDKKNVFKSFGEILGSEEVISNFKNRYGDERSKSIS